MDKRRKRDSRPSLPVVLIVCEGEKTEKQYLHCSMTAIWVSRSIFEHPLKRKH